MPKIRVNLFEGRPSLDIASYAHPGPGQRDHLSAAEIAQISRTVRRVPEAVVKVLPKDSNNLGSINRHLGYIGRYGDLELETDDGDRLSGKGIGHDVIEKWDLDLQEHRRRADLGAALGRSPPKLVHKLMFSMPPGTPAAGVLVAARNFLREEFALKHRYAFVLHTDEPHPHVHAVVKAVSEQGETLNIRKATLREWRAKFAGHLREQGIEANATERAVRGAHEANKFDGIYRAACRGASTHIQRQNEEAARWLADGNIPVEEGKATLQETRRIIERGWRGVTHLLEHQGEQHLADSVSHFVGGLHPPRTELGAKIEQLSEHLRRARVHAVGRVR